MAFYNRNKCHRPFRNQKKNANCFLKESDSYARPSLNVMQKGSLDFSPEAIFILQTHRFVYKSCDYFPSATIFCYFPSPIFLDVLLLQEAEGLGRSPGPLTEFHSAPAPRCWSTRAQMGLTCARYSISFIVQVTFACVVVLTGGMSRTRRRAHGRQSCKEGSHNSSPTVMWSVGIQLRHLPRHHLAAPVFLKCPLTAARWVVMGWFTKVPPSLGFWDSRIILLY